MEPWTPQEGTETVPPADAWVAWLNRAPDPYLVPDPAPVRARVSTLIVVSGLAFFWAAIALIVWRVFF